MRRERTIRVTRLEGNEPSHFDVVVREGKSETRHEVTMSEASFAELAKGSATAERTIEAAFRFLLDREPKESILRHFDVIVIAHYFPEFPSELPRYLTVS